MASAGRGGSESEMRDWDEVDGEKYIESSLQSQGKAYRTRMWANAQRDGRPAEHRWRPLFNAAKFG